MSLNSNDCQATVAVKSSIFGRIKSRLARPTLHRCCVLLQFITAKNENVMGGREESCLKMSTTLSLIVFNQSRVC